MTTDAINGLALAGNLIRPGEGRARGRGPRVYGCCWPCTGGVADPATGCPVSPGTLFWAASTAKGMASTVVHVLAERGELDYDLRVADVWPEFAAHGKGTVTVRHLLCHTAGLPVLPPGTTPDPMRLGAHVRAAGRRRTEVASGYPLWLPLRHFRVPGGRDRAPRGRAVHGYPSLLAWSRRWDDVSEVLGVPGAVFSTSTGVAPPRPTRRASGFATRAGLTASAANADGDRAPGCPCEPPRSARRRHPLEGTMTARAAATKSPAAGPRSGSADSFQVRARWKLIP